MPSRTDGRHRPSESLLSKIEDEDHGDVEATREMCIWCFELLCHKLQRFDLLSQLSKFDNSDDEMFNKSLSSTPLRNQRTQMISDHDSTHTDGLSVLICSSSGSSTIEGSGSETTSSTLRQESQWNRHHRNGLKDLVHLGVRVENDHKNKIRTGTRRPDNYGMISSSTSMGNTESFVPTPPLCIRIHSSRNIRVPLFVTWMNKKHTEQWSSSDSINLSLRGCVGTLEAIPIINLANYADKAAFHDRRFSPINSNEINHLSCRVSILKHFERCSSPYDWDIDVHGLIVNFAYPSGETEREYQATFLPGVAKEHNMTYRRTLEQLVRKAGYKGTMDDFCINSLRVTRYQASKYKISFAEFQDYVKKNRNF